MLPERRRVEFTGPLGNKIAARLDVPAAQPLAYALFAHCFTCGKDLKTAGWISRELVEQRIALFRFDFTGIGESTGDFADTSFTSNLEDLVAAADFMRDNYAAPRILIGHSLGGTAVLAAASRVSEVRAIATIAAPSETSHLREFLTRQTDELGPEESAPVDVMGHRVRIKGQLLDDLRKHDITHDAADLKVPLLVFHSPDDDVVNIREAERIFTAAPHPKSFVSLDGMDHLMVSREEDARYVAELLARWARRYLESE